LDESQTSERVAVNKAQEGDAEAFAVLVRAYQRRAVSVAYRLLNNMEDAADVAQDAFVKAFRNLGQLEDADKFGAWLLRIVGNLSLNFRRARSLRSAVSLDGDFFEDSDAPDAATKFRLVARQDEDTEQGRQMQRLVQEAIATLPEKQALSLILFSVEGLPQKQVAEIVECSVELVKWNVFQARKKLRTLLADHL